LPSLLSPQARRPRSAKYASLPPGLLNSWGFPTFVDFLFLRKHPRGSVSVKPPPTDHLSLTDLPRMCFGFCPLPNLVEILILLRICLFLAVDILFCSFFFTEGPLPSSDDDVAPHAYSPGPFSSCNLKRRNFLLFIKDV